MGTLGTPQRAVKRLLKRTALSVVLAEAYAQRTVEGAAALLTRGRR
jgi:hypothetical protein